MGLSVRIWDPIIDWKEIFKECWKLSVVTEMFSMLGSRWSVIKTLPSKYRGGSSILVAETKGPQAAGCGQICVTGVKNIHSFIYRNILYAVLFSGDSVQLLKPIETAHFKICLLLLIKTNFFQDS